MKLQTLERIKKCLENVGIMYDAQKEDVTNIMIEDSVQFISLIVELENEFQLAIPDDYLARTDAFSTLESLAYT